MYEIGSGLLSRERSQRVVSCIVSGWPILRAATDFLQRHDEFIVVGATCGGKETLA